MPPASVFFPSRDGALFLCILNRSFCFPFEGVLWAEVTLSFYSPHNNKVALCSISLQTSSTYRDHKNPSAVVQTGGRRIHPISIQVAHSFILRPACGSP